VKLKRAPHINQHSARRSTSQGAYLVVGTPFLVLKQYERWFVEGNGELKYHQWMVLFPTRVRALDALQMALEGDPL